MDYHSTWSPSGAFVVFSACSRSNVGILGSGTRCTVEIVSHLLLVADSAHVPCC